METLHPSIATVMAYLLGSLSFAVLVTRAMGMADPRSYGSKNPGATNVLRSGNKKAAVLTLLLDAVKGWLPVFVVKVWGSALGWGEGTLALVGLAAFVGHLFPIFFRFQGGKGVATAAGVVIGFEPLLGLVSLLIWLMVAYFFRYSSLAAITTAVLTPVLYFLGHPVIWIAPNAVILSLATIGLLLIWRHAANINRLLAGTESKIGTKKP